MLFYYVKYVHCPDVFWVWFSDEDQNRNEKEDMIKSESNSQWSEDDSPPILVASQNKTDNKMEPLLKPLAYNPGQHQSQPKV